MSTDDPLTKIWIQVIAHLEVIMRQDPINRKASLVQHMIQNAGPCPDHLGDRLREALKR